MPGTVDGLVSGDGWRAFEAGDLIEAVALFAAGHAPEERAAAAMAGAWIGTTAATGAPEGPTSPLTLFLWELAEALHAASNGDDTAADGHLAVATQAASGPLIGAVWLLHLTALGAAIATRRWSEAGAAADRLVDTLEQTGNAAHLVPLCRSTKWERLTGSVGYPAQGNTSEAVAWLRVFANLRKTPFAPAASTITALDLHRRERDTADLRSQVTTDARGVLEQAWNPQHGCCYPNRFAYPHQWLWDSCFHAVAWAALGDERAITELSSLFSGQKDSGFLPHIRYTSPTTGRGPLPDSSSFTQPPIYAHALRVAATAGQSVPPALIDASGRALDYLWQHRRAANGLIYILHPWEAGADDSPRWDSWVGVETWDIDALSTHDAELVARTQFGPDGVAVWSDTFVCCPASFNAPTAWAFAEHAALTGTRLWHERSTELAGSIDACRSGTTTSNCGATLPSSVAGTRSTSPSSTPPCPRS